MTAPQGVYQLQPVAANYLTGSKHSPNVRHLPKSGRSGGSALELYVQQMRVGKFSEHTIEDRLDLLARLEKHMGVPLLDATPELLYGFQVSFSHLSPASVDVYTRHMVAFYKWAFDADLMPTNPAAKLTRPRVNKGVPHPTLRVDLTTIFACTYGPLRIAYTLAAFAGMRCGEICRMQARDINYGPPVTALIHGKGNTERVIPLLPPVVEEIGYQRGWVITNRLGRPWTPDALSTASSRYLHDLGLRTTLHSMRHAWATDAFRITHDILLVQSVLGHQNLSTTQIYTKVDMDGAHDKLAGMSSTAESLLGRRRLSLVSNDV